ncbi:hypothetical protein EYF80_059007 [Liparis tanakae]|uniref:Uncharacterized protein n=1 Tax=Liparis tanakae TaxID=230148 RepID=A0A4Z2EQF2_9TELE|nr:hypothetical protein EYF80_059007 [Liparis tanakae]
MKAARGGAPRVGGCRGRGREDEEEEEEEEEERAHAKALSLGPVCIRFSCSRGDRHVSVSRWHLRRGEEGEDEEGRGKMRTGALTPLYGALERADQCRGGELRGDAANPPSPVNTSFVRVRVNTPELRTALEVFSVSSSITTALQNNGGMFRPVAIPQPLSDGGAELRDNPGSALSAATDPISISRLIRAAPDKRAVME